MNVNPLLLLIAIFLIILFVVIILLWYKFRNKQSAVQSRIIAGDSSASPLGITEKADLSQTDRKTQRHSVQKSRERAGPGGRLPPPSGASSVEGVIFVSYRRQDSGDVVGRIYDRLVQRFGEDAVFKDVDSIPLGVDFRSHLSTSVGQCDVLLAVIGRQWLRSEKDSRGTDDPRDYVRIEVEAALQREIPVIPILVQGASLPEAESLPPTLQTLAYRNGISIRPDPDFHGDVDRLIRGIEDHLKKKTNL